MTQSSSEGSSAVDQAVGGSGQSADMPYSQKSREHFLNVVVHDLRTPLTSVKGYAQLAMRRLASMTSLNVWRSIAHLWATTPPTPPAPMMRTFDIGGAR